MNIPAFYFNTDFLRARRKRLKTSFVSGTPFENVVIDEFLDSSVLKQLIREFPKPSDPRWNVHGAGRTSSTSEIESARKLGLSDESLFPLFTRHFMQQLNSAPFLKFVESVTGFENLIPDPTFSGGGLHSTGRGGRLLVHTDSNRYPNANPRIHQILNGILYLNEGWSKADGGELELWDESRTCRKKIAPVANRFVLFKTDARTFHGHPTPYQGLKRRNSLAVFYYLVEDKIGTLEGRQRHTNYLPSSAPDRDYARELKDYFEVWIERFHGQSILNNEATEPLLIFDAKKVSPVARRPGLQPFAATGAKALGALKKGWTSLYWVDAEGRIFETTKSETEPKFVMFVEHLMTGTRD